MFHVNVLSMLNLLQFTKIYRKKMKLRTYWITFAAFSFSESLRTLFPLNKDEVKTKY